jgi:hypothetical protein
MASSQVLALIEANLAPGIVPIVAVGGAKDFPLESTILESHLTWLFPLAL